MKYAVDLHMHSCLSPCGDNDMTPNNVVNMAAVKGLDIIAVTDHNTAENLPAILECAQACGLTVVPGIEVETAEEVHIVCLFRTLEGAMQMQSVIYDKLPFIKNRREIFGEQRICNCEDEVIGEIPKMLIIATSIGTDEIFDIVKNIGGVAYPAHVDRDSYSVLSNLGFVPETYKGKYLELSRNCDFQYFSQQADELTNAGYHFFRASDAHYLWDIFERENFMELSEKSVDAVIDKLSALRESV